VCILYVDYQLRRQEIPPFADVRRGGGLHKSSREMNGRQMSRRITRNIEGRVLIYYTENGSTLLTPRRSIRFVLRHRQARISPTMKLNTFLFHV